MTSGVMVEFTGADGYTWTLAAPDSDPTQSVFLLPESLKGFAGKVTWSHADSVAKYGERRTGWKIEPLEMKLEFGIRSHKGELEEVSRRWERSWDFENEGVLELRSPVGGRFWTFVSEPVFPDWDESLTRKSYRAGELSFRGHLGHWFGETQEFTGSSTVNVGGDRPLSPSCRLVWSGEASSVKFPSGVTVSFPALGSKRYINLDYGMSAQVTREDGSVDTNVWSGLQGKVTSVSLKPGVDSEWTLGPGMTLEVTPRYLSPWR